MIKFGGEGILLDIEGTTSSISFVHDVMFPYVRRQLMSFLSLHFQDLAVQSACDQIARDAGYQSLQHWQSVCPANSSLEMVQQEVLRLMDGDVKATGLKALQGLIWESGFSSGELRSHVYPDVVPAIRRWRSAKRDIRIYSSGSIAAQKLFFAHVDGLGNCLELFSGNYDTTIGSKKESSSYTQIARDWSLAPSQILFISDVGAELAAAASAGLQIAASVRPGNAPLSQEFEKHAIYSFDEIELSPIFDVLRP